MLAASAIENLCGVDEAGRGPLAGNVYAAAVILDPDQPIIGLADSKVLSESKREVLYEEIINQSLAFAIAFATVQEIDEINILQATLCAMTRAINQLTITPDLVLVDGNHLPKINIKAQAIIKGDSKVKAISAASILAKVARDREMVKMDKLYPEYGFAKHKGYGTKEHIRAINQYGVLAIHRRSFAPIKQMVTADLEKINKLSH